MKVGIEPGDCPLCQSAGSVYAGFCQVCLANLEGRPAPLAHPEARRPEPMDDPGRLDGPEQSHDPVRFTEVMEELRAVALLAAEGEDGPVGAACLRAELLLERLRRQFMADVVFGTHQPASVA